MLKLYKEIYNLISDEITKGYLFPYEEDLIKTMNTDSFIYSLRKLIFDNRYSAFALMDLLYPMYKKYWQVSEKEILEYIYDWILSLSFPEKLKRQFNDKLDPLVSLYLNLLRIFSIYEMKCAKNSFLCKYPLEFLTSEEENGSKSVNEYLKFKQLFIDNWIYELMKIDLDLTGHNTLEHVIGVNSVSLYISRQLKQLNLPIDLGIVVGASLGHDVGKYGVRDEDKERVPYLHYYYTEKWFNRFDLHTIGHIATNHSTWDLELENLPIESLVLIYADFRVKNKGQKMNIFSLDDAYNVILKKLDNLDTSKERRYEKVFNKLKDFENYMISLGIDTTLVKDFKPIKNPKPFALMDDNEVIDNIKYFAIEHNIYSMKILLDDTSFNKILDVVRNEYSWRKIRLYIQIFKEYSTYLTQKQKTITLNFASELLLHREDDIRREASELIGLLISKYDEEYRKEIPKIVKANTPTLKSEKILDKFLNNILRPNHKISDSQIELLYNLQYIIKSLFYNARVDHYEKYSRILLKYYDNFEYFPYDSQLYLCQTLSYVPVAYLCDEDINKLNKYILNQLNSKILEVRLTIMDIIDEIHKELKESKDFVVFFKKWILKNLGPSSNTSESYLKYKLALKFNMHEDILTNLNLDYNINEKNTSDIFLNNLKTATEWTNKKINIDILYDHVKRSPNLLGFHTAMHFCNLLKVSEIEKVRNYAGHTLLSIFKFLSLEERNDIVIELLRALEMQNYQFTKFIPDYLGQLLLYLHPKELDEAIDDFEEKIKQSNPKIVFLLLRTLGIAIENYPLYSNRFDETKKSNEDRLIDLITIILNGMVSFDVEIKAEAFRIIGGDIFNSRKLLIKEKLHVFKLLAKKILTLLPNIEEDEFIFLNNSASLNHIYRFISDYELHYGNIKLENNKKIAFFPGSFDPFSLSHKEIALEIRKHGFEVYLAVDEFSWSKRVQPHKIRKNIIFMTIAHEKDIYLFPSKIPINISNNKDLTKLKDLFKGKDVYIVVGADVIVNASAYEKDGVLREFSHIIFNRNTVDDKALMQEKLKGIKGDVLRLSLPPQYKDISSSDIRKAIDLNMDISKKIDPLAQQYIYKYGLYLNEPRYKSLIQTKTIKIEIVKNIDNNIIQYLHENFRDEININSITILKSKLEPSILLVKDNNDNTILGFSTFYWVKNTILYSEFQNTDITNYIRNYLYGKLVFISGIYVNNNDSYLAEIVLNETLAYCILSDYTLALYSNSLTLKDSEYFEEILKLQGFIKAPFNHNNNPVFVANMNNPITLSQDLDTLLKPPFDNNCEIKSAINNTRNKLKKALASLYPGELVLTFNRDMIYSKLIQKICDINQVSTMQNVRRTLGPYMCVPFGSILNSRILPNTVTKSMHTEKIFNSNINGFTIGAFPNYLNLESQAKMLASFNRPIILLDDLLHKGYRLNVIEPILKSNELEVKKLIVGILTGRGKELGEIRNIDVDSAYFIPNLKLWFNESSQYPFIGGDAVARNKLNHDYLIPSVNLILPYAAPKFIKNTSLKLIYNLSETCLLNSIEIFRAIENIYQDIHGKNLVIKNLGQILISPRKPDTMYKSMDIIKNSKPSDYLQDDLEHLNRIKYKLEE